MNHFGKRIGVMITTFALLTGTILTIAASAQSVSTQPPVDSSVATKTADMFDIRPYLLKDSYATAAELDQDYEAKYFAYLKVLPDYTEDAARQIDAAFQKQVMANYQSQKSNFPAIRKAAANTDQINREKVLKALQFTIEDDKSNIRLLRQLLAENEEKKTKSDEIVSRDMISIRRSEYQITAITNLRQRLESNEITWRQAQAGYEQIIQAGAKIQFGEEYEVSVYPLVSE